MALINGNFFIRGTRNDDQIFGGLFPDHIDAGAGNDSIFGGGGNDYIDGGAGRDTALFSQEFFKSSITRSQLFNTLTVTGPDGNDTLEKVEVLSFGGLEVDIKGAIASRLEGGSFFDPTADMRLTGINNSNSGATSIATRFSLLADGSAMNSEARQGTVTVGDVIGDDRGTALFLVTNSDSGRLRLNNLWDANQHIELGDLDDLQFDYFIGDSSRTDVIPVIRLLIDADGNLATTNDRGELVFEWAYQGFGTTVVETWQTADLAGDDWVAWQRSNGTNWDQIVNMTVFSDWADADGFTPVGGIHFDEHSLVIGWSVALGSGNGTGAMLVDNLQIGPTTYEFAFA